MAEEEKALGNEAFKTKDYNKAIQHFSNALQIAPNHVLYSNRSACHCAIADYEKALDDAEKAIKQKPDWGKGYGRKGAALHGLRKYDDAIKAYNEGLAVEPNLPMLTNGLAESERAAAGAAGGADDGGMGALGNVFAAPDLLQKVAANPQTASFLADPAFVAKLQELQRNPGAIAQNLQDQRILSVMGMLMGVNIQTADPSMGDAPPPPPPKKPEPEPEPEPMLTPEQEARRAQKAEADKDKDLGNAAYKEKRFDEAVGHYNKAIEALPDEITYYNNLAAVKFEQTDFEGCIATCKEGITRGREVRADFKLVAKAFARIGNAYKKQGMLAEAIRAYEDSLVENRTPEVDKLMKQTVAAKRKADEEAYCSPEKAEEARQEGNEHFKAGKYPEAIKCYTEAMRRNPKDHVPYSNRAACYQKLMEWQLATKDADHCVEMDPTFIKGWSRKAGIHFFLKEYHKALDAYNEILKIDPNNEDANNMCEQVLREINAANASGEVDPERQARAMADPEVQEILGDMQMRSILQEMQTDPKKAQAAMKDPAISAKLQKLIAAGVLQVR